MVFISQDREPRGIIPLENLQVREVQDSKRKVTLSLLALDEKQLNKLKGLYCKIVSIVTNCTLLLFLFSVLL